MSRILTPILFVAFAVITLATHLAAGIGCALGEWWAGIREIWRGA